MLALSLCNIFLEPGRIREMQLAYFAISQGFDCVHHETLIGKLRHYGVTGRALDLLKSYLSNRVQRVDVNVYINDLPSLVKDAHEIVLFADDTSLLFKVKRQQPTYDDVNNAISKLFGRIPDTGYSTSSPAEYPVSGRRIYGQPNDTYILVWRRARRAGFNLLRIVGSRGPFSKQETSFIWSVAEYDSTRCFIHLLQRVITESLKCQPDLMEMLAASRRIVTHFNHSALAQEKLKAIQKELNLPEHQLVQYVSTRWNSTYYLQERLLEQKRAVSLYIADHDKLSNLTPHQWNLMEQCISLLKPFEEITKITSSGLSCIFEVVPHVATFMRYLQKEETARKVPNLLHVLMSLKTEIEQHFQHLDDDPKYFLATLLDPRFKTSFFGIIQTEKARKKLLLQGLKMSCSEEDSNSSEGKIGNTTEENLGYGVVLDLLEAVPENALVAFDQFYASLELLTALYERKILTVCTVNSNKKGLPEIITKKTKETKLNPGEFQHSRPISVFK
ncbi:Zinc finger BED domain-containing protein 4 [Eumeta japonica]|uniref:Zinc finger BED domain-containing protein 4 n=1 Tax=Eumeta variegata TaxID=151549 RepID=A0A4C1XMH5_EUMVA|nr:Zinc finger BED domain-containing protein 4 [Eumeta japonica]